MVSGEAISEVIRRAGSEETSVEELIKLAENTYFAVRESVAGNKKFEKLPVEVQKALIGEDPDIPQSREVCKAAAHNPGLNESLYELAAHNKNPQVRAAFASNETESKNFTKFLMMLLLDPEKEVRLSAIRNKTVKELDLTQPNIIEVVKAEEDPELLVEFSKCKLSKELFEILVKKGIAKAKDGDKTVINALLSNPDLPNEFREQIINSQKRKLRI